MSRRKLSIIYAIIIFLVVLVVISFKFFSQSKTEALNPKTTVSKSVCDVVLRKEAIKPVKTFDGVSAKVNFSKDPVIDRFRTTVLEQVEKGPNFAGHFRFVSWGCGTSCLSYVIIDLVTRERVMANNTEIIEFMTPSYNINSRILVFNSKENPDERIRGKTLEEIKNLDDYFTGISRGREYYELREEDDGQIWLNKLCTENYLDGIYGY